MAITQIDRRNDSHYPPATPQTPEERRMEFLARVVRAYDWDPEVRKEINRMFTRLSDVATYQRLRESKSFLPRKRGDHDDEFQI